jgi:transposase
MNKRYRVHLTPDERADLERRIATGTGSARRLAHARILLKADEAADGPALTDEAIAAAVEVGTRTVERTRERFVEDGLEFALAGRQRQTAPLAKLDGEKEAHLLAIACSQAPEGRKRWTLRLLAERMVELQYVDDLSYETVRRTLKKTNSSPGGASNGASPPAPTPNSSRQWSES